MLNQGDCYELNGLYCHIFEFTSKTAKKNYMKSWFPRVMITMQDQVHSYSCCQELQERNYFLRQMTRITL